MVRTMTTTEEIRQWLGVGGITDRLATIPRPQLADLGCGTAGTTIVLGEQFPAAGVVGLDVDLAAVEEARANVACAGRAAQIAIRCCDAVRLAGGPYDLVTAFGLLHGSDDPAGILAAARACLATAGEVLVVDEWPVGTVAEAAGFDHVRELAVDRSSARAFLLR